METVKGVFDGNVGKIQLFKYYKIDQGRAKLMVTIARGPRSIRHEISVEREWGFYNDVFYDNTKNIRFEPIMTHSVEYYIRRTNRC